MTFNQWIEQTPSMTGLERCLAKLAWNAAIEAADYAVACEADGDNPRHDNAINAACGAITKLLAK